MRVLLVSNSTQRCGIAEYGRLMARALLGAGVDVTEWWADYPTYLPSTASEFDIIHLNWHPVTINHILPQHIPAGPKLSVFFHESVPEWEVSGYPVLWPRADVRFVSEPMTGGIFFQVPCPDHVPRAKVHDKTRIGHTGIRRDGLDRIAPVCEANGWELSTSKGWLSMEEEVERLAACHVNVCHYHGGYSGQSMGAMTLVAARRPVLINSNRMLKTLWPYAEGHNRWPPQLYRIEDAEEGVKQVLGDIARGVERLPLELAEEMRWSNRINLILEAWR